MRQPGYRRRHSGRNRVGAAAALAATTGSNHPCLALQLLLKSPIYNKMRSHTWQAAVQHATSSCHWAGWAARGPLPSSAPTTLAVMMEGSGRGFCPTHGASIVCRSVSVSDHCYCGFVEQSNASKNMMSGLAEALAMSKRKSSPGWMPGPLCNQIIYLLCKPRGKRQRQTKCML
jgi:hypothetical protein